MHVSGNVNFRGTSVAASKVAVPKIVHPLATPGCVIVVQFILNCISNVVVFGLTYSFLLLAIPVALLLKVVKRCALYVRLLSQGLRLKVEIGSAEEKFWFVSDTANEMSPSLVLLLVLKGEVSVQTVECLVRNRLSYSKDNDKTHLCRLARIPSYVFHELIWTDGDLVDDKVVSEVKLVGVSRVFELEKRKCIIESTSSHKDWRIYLYSNREAPLTIDNNLILFRFHHCYADINTLVQFLSRNFLDSPTFAFRGEVPPSQAFCLGVMALFSGPSIFFRALFKTNDRIFSEAPSKNRRAIFYSEFVSREEIETITTATGASVNDVVLSTLAGSLRSCLRQNGVVFPPDVNVYLPMNFQSSSSLKCFTSFNIFSLPVGTEGALPRLWEMRLRRNHLTSLIQAITMNTIIQLAFLILPDALARRLIQFLMEKSSCAVTCILGQTLKDDLLVDGRPVETFIPIEDTGHRMSITIIEYQEKFQLAVLAPDAEDWVIKPPQLCAAFTFKLREFSARLVERARVIRARGQRLLNSRKNSVFIVEEEEEEEE